MEIAIAPHLPTYSGGLGVLAGDSLRSAADHAIPMVAITLVHRSGYFHQSLNELGVQSERPVQWNPADHLREVAARVQLQIEGRAVTLRAWRHDIEGVNGHRVPVFLLDADVEGNAEWDRRLTDVLYGGDERYRLCQEVILGIGGIRMLRALGLGEMNRFHMNEGHASLLTIELAHERMRLASEPIGLKDALAEIKPLCVFTTHTPVASGHDQFPLDLVGRVITEYGDRFDRQISACCLDHVLNMTYLALSNSHYVNGVAKRHGELARHMFSAYAVDSITNGVHVATWAAAAIQALFDRYIRGWRTDNGSLRYALGIPKPELWNAHLECKAILIAHVNAACGTKLDREAMTLGFARRATAYKRHDLVFWDLDRLVRLHENKGPIQLIFGGKAHPRDFDGKRLIESIYAAKAKLAGKIEIAYVEDYDVSWAKLLTSGCDLWLNTPQEPLEASGTSGMKAAVNGVPSLSVPDGWWLEGGIEGVTGWTVGPDRQGDVPIDDRAEDAAALYDKLEEVILPLYYRSRDAYLDVMRHAVALNGSFFNTERMMDQYVLKAYYE